MDKNQRQALSLIAKMNSATFVNKGVIDCSYIVEIRQGKHITAKELPLFCVYPRSRKSWKADKNIHAVGSAIVGEPVAILTRTRQVSKLLTSIHSLAGCDPAIESMNLFLTGCATFVAACWTFYYRRLKVCSCLSGHDNDISPSSESGEEREERAECRLTGFINELQAVLPPTRWRGVETERGIGSMRGCTGRDQVWCPTQRSN